MSKFPSRPLESVAASYLEGEVHGDEVQRHQQVAHAQRRQRADSVLHWLLLE